ncbi:hypothetical protein K438DRAFT_1557215, partial [Mycena galopus ATCC 62051]
SGCGFTYTVVSGDTCSTIESKTGASDSQLHALNRSINIDCTNLQIGEVLCLNDSGCRTTYLYCVSGDSCPSIESKTEVSDSQLHSLNPTINSDRTSTFPYPCRVSAILILSPARSSTRRSNSACKMPYLL